MSRCENGTEDIISTRSKAFQALQKGVDDLSISQFVDLIQKNPSILKRPILLSDKTMVVGYDDDEITAVTPSYIRKGQNAPAPEADTQNQPLHFRTY